MSYEEENLHKKMNTNESNILKEMKLISGLERRICKKTDVFENRVNQIEKTFKNQLTQG